MVQVIGEKIDQLDGDQTGHHIHNQCGELVFISTENYSLANRNENFEISEESSREKTFLSRSWAHSNSGFLRCGLGMVSF